MEWLEKKRLCGSPKCRRKFNQRTEEHRFCSIECLYDAKKFEQKRREIEMKKKHREQKERLKTIPQLERAADRAFAMYIHERDHGSDCCSCVRTFEDVEGAHAGKPGGTWDCCHYLSKAEYPQHRYDPHNAALGCKSCNAGESKRRRGSRSEYIQANFRKTLVERFGESEVSRLENNKVRVKYTKKKLRMIAAEFREAAKEMRKVRGLA